MRAPMRASLAAVAVAFVALTSLAAPVAAGAEGPFKGSLEGVEATTGAFPIVTVHGESTGNATHLGKFTAEYCDLVDLRTGSGTGSWVFRAANGDAVTAAGFGQAHLPPTNGVFSIEEHWTITGGTGRFAGATGSFTVERSLNVATSLTTGSFDGTISSPAAGKPDRGGALPGAECPQTPTVTPAAPTAAPAAVAVQPRLTG
jgi:hypothetical protein